MSVSGRRRGRRPAAGGESKSSATRNHLGRLAGTYGVDSQGRPRVTAYEHRSTSVPRYTPVKGVTKSDPNFSVGGNRMAGGASRTIDQSPPTPKDLRDPPRGRRRSVAAKVRPARASAGPEGPGPGRTRPPVR